MQYPSVKVYTMSIFLYISTMEMITYTASENTNTMVVEPDHEK